MADIKVKKEPTEAQVERTEEQKEYATPTGKLVIKRSPRSNPVNMQHG